jgi:hypothetical protein
MTVRSTIRFLRYDLPQGLRSLWYWLPVIWKWRNWDWAYTVDVLIHSLEAQREQEVRYKRHACWARKAKDLSITIEALRRLRNENDDDMLMLVPDEKGLLGMSLVPKPNAFLGTKKSIYARERDRQKMYLDIATTQMRKHLTQWWD